MAQGLECGIVEIDDRCMILIDIVIYYDDVSLFEQRGTRNMKSHTYSHSRVDISKKGCVKFGGGAASFCRAYVWGRVLRCGEEMALLQLQHAMTHQWIFMDFSGSCKGWYVVYNHPISSIYHLYTTYILPSGRLSSPYHLLREPETTIEHTLITSTISVCFAIHSLYLFLD